MVDRLGTAIPDSHPIITWLVQYAGAVHRRFSVGEDGKTPSERISGRKCTQLMAEFGERIWWMPLDPDGDLPSPGDRFVDGFWAVSYTHLTLPTNREV